MAYQDPDPASWDLLDPRYSEDFNNYGLQPQNGFVYPLDIITSYTIQPSSEDISTGVLYPTNKSAYNLPPSLETSPTDVFQTVPSTSYNTPDSFEYPLFEPFDKVPFSGKTSSLALLHTTDSVEHSTCTYFDPLFSDSIHLNAINHECDTSPITNTGAELDTLPTPKSRKRRQPSESSQSDDNLARARRTRIVKAPKATAKVRVIGACLYCKRRRTTCREGHDPDGPCLPCLELAEKVTVVSGLLRPLCWRPPKLKTTELFRRGPTIDFAASLRGRKSDAKPGKQAVWDLFATGSKSKQPSRVVQLTQYWTSNTLSIELHRYIPMETDKQHYTWYEDDIERHYDTPAYGIANWRKVYFSIERFMEQNFKQYIDAHLRDASEISRTTFEIALDHKHLHLVDRALKIWVGCRYIEKPWSIVSSETLSMSLDPNPSSPYHDRIPIPPIVDMQIDLIVINSILQPLLKETLAMMTELQESSASWKDWFEIYLAYFVLLHNVELTMAHDAWFVKRHNLKTKYSNTPLMQTIMQGATTLLSCFHYVHQGYAPFTDPELESSMDWTEAQRAYVKVMRGLLKDMKGECVLDPRNEGFWTSQLGRSDWRPVFVS